MRGRERERRGGRGSGGEVKRSRDAVVRKTDVAVSTEENEKDAAPTGRKERDVSAPTSPKDGRCSFRQAD